MPWVAVPPVANAHDASTTPSTVGLGGAATAIVVVCQLNPNPNVLPCMSGLRGKQSSILCSLSNFWFIWTKIIVDAKGLNLFSSENKNFTCIFI